MSVECIVCSNQFSGNHKPVIDTCGHSTCISCRRNLSNFRCPICNEDEAFEDETVNYQLLEIIEAFNLKEAIHVAELFDVRNDFESLKKQHGDRGLELSAVREEKSSMLLKLADLEKKVNESIADEERFNESRWKCSEFSDLMEQQKSRICVSCGEKSGFLHMENGALKISDIAKADKAVFCATCGLDKEHKGHFSLPYLKRKFLHDSGVDFAKIFDSVTLKTDGCTEQIGLLKTGGDKILEVLKLLCAKAADLNSLLDYDDLFSHCEDVKNKYDELVSELEANIKAHVEKANRLEVRLQHVLKDEPFEEEEEENKPAGDV